MSNYVDCSIKISKGEPKEVLDVICPRDGVIDLSTVAVSEEAKKFWKGDLANVADGATAGIIEFSVKNFTPDAIFDDLAKRFPQHEFEVRREPSNPEYPTTVLLFKDGEFQMGFETMDGKTVWRQIPKLSGLVVKRDSQTRITAEHVNRMLSGRTIQSVEAGTDGWILLNLAPLPDSNPDIEREFVTVYVGNSEKYRERTGEPSDFSDIYLRAEYKTGSGRLMLAPRIHMWGVDDSQEP